jgi:type I restriction enzyme S subunit
MNAELLLQHFHRLGDAPDAVPRLRRFILDLAVRGKLVEQNAEDEPASVLLKKMVVERKKKVEAKLFKKTKELSGVELDQQSFTIPSNWYWTRLGVIADWGSGSTPSRSNHDYYGGSHTWLKSGELNDVIGLRGSEEHVTERAIKECSFRLNQPEDVLIAMYGATIGKLAILAEIAVTNQAVCGCTTLSGVSNRYLFNFLMAQRAAFHSQSEGGAQPNISRAHLKKDGGIKA